MVGGEMSLHMDRLHKGLQTVGERARVLLLNQDKNVMKRTFFSSSLKPDLLLPPILPSVLTWLMLVSTTQRQKLMAVLSLVPLLVAVRAEHAAAVLAGDVPSASHQTARGG